MKRIIYFFIFLSFIFTSAYSQNSFVTDSLEQYVNSALKLWNIPGAAVVIVKDGKVVVAKGFGVKEISKPGNIDENTLFMIASNSKSFTGTALSYLDYEKKLSLDDKVIKWMPEFRMFDSAVTPMVTIRDLLCHRLGLQTFQGDFINWSSDLSRKEIIYNFRNLKPVFDFRARYGYCNAGFMTAGEIIPAVTGKTWEEYVKEKILMPLNMDRTSVSGKIMMTDENVSKGHSLYDFKNIKTVPFDEVDNLGPAASICTSAKDIANWLLMQTDSGRFNGNPVIPFKVLQRTYFPNISIGINQNPVFAGKKHLKNYGLGWQIEDYCGKLLVSHTGGVNGFVTSTCFLPEMKLGIAVFTNTDANYLYEALKYQIIESYLGLPEYTNYSNLFYGNFEADNEENLRFYIDQKTIGEQNFLSFPLDEYTGNYYNKAYGHINVRNDNGKLKINFEHHKFLTGELMPVKQNSFLCIYNHPGWGMKPIDFIQEIDAIRSVIIRVSDNIDMMEYKFIKTEK